MYYCYNCPMNPYRNEECQGGACKISIVYFEDEMKNGHQGHFYKTRIKDMYPYPVTIQLIGLPGNNLVSLNVFDRRGRMEYTSIDADDLTSIAYLGPIPPHFRSQDAEKLWYPWETCY